MTTGGREGDRIVVSRLRFLGDVVLSTPLLAALRRALPRARIEYVTHARFAPVLDHHPAVDRVIAFPDRPGLRETADLVRDLRRPRADWILDLLSNPRSAVQVALARPRASVGQHAGVRSLAYRYRRPRPEGSQVAAHLDKAVPLLGPQPPARPRLYVTEPERADAAARLGLGGEGRDVFVHPVATHAWRTWPLDRWPPLVHALGQAFPDARVHVVCPPGSEAEAARVARASGAEALPPLRIRDLMAALSHGALYVGNDGGFLHVAVALGLPTVGLSGGENDPDHWFPYADFGPYRALLAPSAERFPDGKGRSFPRPDASPDAVMDLVREVLLG